MRKCFTAKGFLLFSSWHKSRCLYFSQGRNASPRAGPGNNNGLLDLLDQAEQDIIKQTDPRRSRSRDVSEAFLDESMQGLRSSMPDLPLSPLMDPKLISARQRYRTPKLLPTGETSALEKKLAKSPYARALATPIRHCRLTDTRLPSYFLLGFGIMRNPVTGTQWQLPKLAVDPLVTAKAEEASAETSFEDEDPDGTPVDQSTVDVSLQSDESWKDTSESVSLGTEFSETRNPDKTLQRETTGELPSKSQTVEKTFLQDSKTNALSPTSDSRNASASYFICSQPVMRELSAFQKRSWMRVIPLAWKNDSGIAADNLVWRKDMDRFVLELLRKKVFRLLEALASSRGGYISSSAGYNYISRHHQAAGVLWMGAKALDNMLECHDKSASSETHTSQEEVVFDQSSPGVAAPLDGTNRADHSIIPEAEVPSAEDAEPPFYSMFKYKSHYIPIYNLPTLLGPEYVTRLRATAASLQGTMAVIKSKSRTVKAQMELWKLMGYLAPAESLGTWMAEVQGDDSKGGGGKMKGGKGGKDKKKGEKADSGNQDVNHSEKGAERRAIITSPIKK